MKKIFTLALAGAAVLTASAGPRLMTSAPVFEPVEKNALFEEIAAAAVESRADMDFTGTYYNGAYEVQGDNATQQVIGEFIERMEDIEIVADPERPNGYIIKNLFATIFGKVNDIKAAYNPITGMFSFDAGQELCVVDNGGEQVKIQMYTSDGKGTFLQNDPIMFAEIYGQLVLQENTGIFFGEWRSQGGQEGLYSNGLYIQEFLAYRPNGEMSYFDVNEGKEKSCPIYGLNYSGLNLVYNFAGVDPLRNAPFSRRGTRVVMDGSFYTARRLYYAPTINPEWNINETLFLAQTDEDGIPQGTGNGDDLANRFYIRGTIVTDLPTECVIELPDCGLFTEEDAVYNLYKNVVITYDPAIAGIESVTATDNTNAPVVYYNLQGMRVENPSNGIFIRQQGTESTKVLVK